MLDFIQNPFFISTILAFFTALFTALTSLYVSNKKSKTDEGNLEIASFNSLVEANDKFRNEVRKELDYYIKHVTMLRKQVSDYEFEISTLRKKIIHYEAEIKELTLKLQKYENSNNSNRKGN